MDHGSTNYSGESTLKSTLRTRISRSVLALSVVASMTIVAGCKGTDTTHTVHRPDTIVSTDKGAVRGRVVGTSLQFQGIPYAAPPVGALRWASPEPAARWSGIRNATKPGNRCAQAQGLIDRASVTEDCLYLNVTSPRKRSSKKLPVMVWIHGNGFINGAGSLYDAQRMATIGNVIVVAPNYRLGIFGFLAHPALDGGKAKNLSGNFGLEDQQAALRWVRRNAAAFGGDPNNVTIFGESAGGTSVCSHLAAPGSAGLFQRAIVQSAECTGGRWSPGPPTWFPLSRAVRERHGVDVATKLGCPDMPTAADCLRKKSVRQLARWSDDGTGSGPTVGGGVLPVNPGEAFAAGRFNRVPVIEGTTRDEHRLFTAAIEAATHQPTTAASYETELKTLFGAPAAARVLSRYPISRFHSAGEALSSVITDWAWGCPVLDRDEALAAKVPTYAYEFDDDTSPWFSELAKPNFPTGAFHGAELQYLFADPQLPGPKSSGQRQLSTAMIHYWTQFAATGNPNGHGETPWPAFGATHHVQSLRPGGRMASADLATEHQCGFWSTIDRRP